MAAAPLFPTLDLSALTHPRRTGSGKLKLHAVSDLAAALALVARLRAHGEAVEAARKQQANRLNEAAAAARQVEVNGDRQAAEQYELELLQAIEEYVPVHKSEIFEDGRQTARFPAGEVAWRDKPAEVVLEEGVKPAEIAERIVKRKKLVEQARALLDEAGVADILRVKFELDLLTIKRLFADGKFRRSQLPAGLTVAGDTEVVSVKPFSGPERSDQAA